MKILGVIPVVVTLQCTSPLRQSEDTEKALEYFISKKLKA